MRLALSLLALATFLPAPAAAQDDCGRRLVIGSLQTEYRPVRDFQRVVVVLANLNDPLERYERHLAADAAADYTLGVRVLEQCVEGPDDDRNSQDYRMGVSLLRDDGTTVGYCAENARWGDPDHALGMACDIRAPDGGADKTVRLLADVDHSGSVSPGDLLRYEVRIQAPKATSFRDFMGSGSRLVSGTVSTSHGHVQYGNGVEDEAVVVGDLRLARYDETVVIRYDAYVDFGVVSNQGELFLSGLEGSTGYLRTDWPESPFSGAQATEAPVACPASSGDLAECSAEVERLEALVANLHAAIFDLVSDDDADGLIDISDHCPDSERGAPIDARGCTQAQFCGALDAGTRAARRICKRSDWGNDEPLAAKPGDCGVKARRCVPTE